VKVATITRNTHQTRLTITHSQSALVDNGAEEKWGRLGKQGQKNKVYGVGGRCRIADSERVSYCVTSRVMICRRHHIFFLNSKVLHQKLYPTISKRSANNRRYLFFAKRFVRSSRTREKNSLHNVIRKSNLRAVG
jgi:hypothetical protein